MDATPEHTTNDRRRAARAEASAWIVRLHGPNRTADLEAGFRAWLDADPENGRQFERVTEVWEAGATPVPGIARMGHWQEGASASPARKWLLAAALAVVAIGTGIWGANYFWLNPAYTTGIGEQRIVRLSDGTRITLNSDSRVAVAYRDAERRVRVDRGEAYFEVAKDTSRPFLVRVGEHEVKALGTSFIVRYEPLRIAVTLVEGKVAVSSVPPSPISPTEAPNIGAVTYLAPGQRVVFAESKPPTLDEPRIEAVTAWRRGEVMLDKTPLVEAIAEMNRYDRTTLVVDAPGIEGLQVSGIYHTGDNEIFAQMISRLYGLEAIHEPGRIRLTAPRTPASD